MMKPFMILSLAFHFLFSTQVLASKAKSDVLLDVSFEQTKVNHKYTLEKTLEKEPAYTLIFKDKNKKAERLKVSRTQAELILNEATRIIWDSQYRHPAKAAAPCQIYMRLNTKNEKAKICRENPVLTGRSYGFLNSLHGLLK